MTESSGSQRRADALRAAATHRSETAVKAAERGIRTLVKDGGRISFLAVARTAGVSAKFLHQHPELSQRIRQLRDQQSRALEQAGEAQASGESAVIAALRRLLRDQESRHRAETQLLRARLAEQDKQIAALYGQLQRWTD